MASDIVFVGQFIASKAGKTGLTVTVDVDRYTISDGTRSELVTAGSATEGRRGLYHYRLASADLSLYQYVATFITADATVDQQQVAAIGLVVPDALVGSRATQTSVDDVPTVAEFNARTLAAAAYFDPATDTVSANMVEMNGDTDPVDNLVLALGTGGLVEKLNSMLEAAGLAYRFTAEALAEIPIEAGSGTGTYTDTIKDPSNNPLDGARVQLSTDAAGIHRIYEAFTNALGVFVMNPDPGTYYRWIDLAGYTDRLTQGAQVTVT